MRIDRYARRFGVVEKLRHGAGSAHGMPMVAQAPGIESKRKSRVDGVGDRLVCGSDEVRAAALRREYAVGVQALVPALCSLGKRPLLGAAPVEKRVAEARDVQVAASSRLAMLVENLFRRRVRKQRSRSRVMR